VHKGNTPPETCPVCGAGSEEFEPCREEKTREVNDKDERKVVIVGGGIAGVSAAEAVRQTLPHAEIILFTSEKDLPYYRLNLTRRLAGEITDEDLPIHPEAWYEERSITVRRGTTINGVDPDDHTLSVEGGEAVSYDKLIFAGGAHPFIPPIPGADLRGVTAVRTLKDAHHLLSLVKKGASCVCIGGGILGLETAGALAKQGVKVTLLEAFDYLLPRQLNRDAAEVLAAHVAELGIVVRTSATTESFEGNDAVEAVVLQDGTRLQTSAVTITTGIRANSYLARRAGLAVNQGIIVDAHMATSHPDIFAAVDCAEFEGTVAGLWEPAQYQGAIAGFNAAGSRTEFGGIPRMNTLKVLGIKLFSIGVIQPDDGSYTEIVDQDNGKYRRFLFHDGLLAGAILIGDTRLAAAATRASKEHMDFSDVIHGEASIANVADYLEQL